MPRLTGEGATLIGSHAIHALEEVLPARYGGTPLDYEPAEEEDAHGLTRVKLIIDASVPIDDEREVAETFMEATGYGSSRPVWRPLNTPESNVGNRR